MNVQVALVHVDRRYWLDRRIAKLRGGQKYSHAGFIVSTTQIQPKWVDVHWRWFKSDLREIPLANYSWNYDIYDVKGLKELKAIELYHWLKHQEGSWIVYDLVGAASIALGLSCVQTPRCFTCFEFIARGLQEIGLPLTFDPEVALASDLLASGRLLFDKEVLL